MADRTSPAFSYRYRPGFAALWRFLYSGHAWLAESRYSTSSSAAVLLNNIKLKQ